MAQNKHGLTRNIPNDVKYTIRREAGFGCAGCGIAIGQYEHIEPPFVDAIIHDPDRMTFLCAHCHDKVTRGFISKETVWDWKKHPWCIKHGHCHESFNIGDNGFSLWIGGAKVTRVENILTYDGEHILRIRKPEENGAPYRISAKFHDKTDNKALEIQDNEWIAYSTSFDVICGSGKIGIRTPDGFALKIVCFPPRCLVIESVDMLYNGLRINANPYSLRIEGPCTGGVNIAGRLLTAIDDGCSLFSFSSESSGVRIGQGIQFAPLTESVPSKPLSSYSCRKNATCPCGSGVKYKKCCFPKYDYTF